MGGLFRLDPTVAARDVELVVGLDAVVEARVVPVHVVGGRAPTVVVSLVDEIVCISVTSFAAELATVATRTIFVHRTVWSRIVRDYGFLITGVLAGAVFSDRCADFSGEQIAFALGRLRDF